MGKKTYDKNHAHTAVPEIILNNRAESGSIEVANSNLDRDSYRQSRLKNNSR